MSSNYVDQHFTPTAITADLPPTVTIADHGITNGQALRATQFITFPLASATGMEQLNNRLFFAQNVTTNTLDLYDEDGVAIDGRGYTTYISGGQFTRVGPELPYEIVTS